MPRSKKINRGKIKLKAFVYLYLGLLSIALLLGIIASGKKQDIQKQAAFGNVSITLRLPAGQILPDQDLPIQVLINAGSYRVSSIRMKVKYDPAILAFINLNDGSQPLNTRFPDSPNPFDEGGKKVLEIVYLRADSNRLSYPSGTFLLTTLNFKALANSGSAGTYFEVEPLQITGLNPTPLVNDQGLNSSLASLNILIGQQGSTPNPTVAFGQTGVQSETCDACGWCNKAIAPSPPGHARCYNCLYDAAGNEKDGRYYSVLGCIGTDPASFTNALLSVIFAISGGIAFLSFIYGSMQILTSQGDFERLKAGKEIVTSSIIGLMLVIFSVFLLRIIGLDVLNLPGFG